MAKAKLPEDHVKFLKEIVSHMAEHARENASTEEKKGVNHLATLLYDAFDNIEVELEDSEEEE